MADESHGGHEPGAGGTGKWVFWGFLLIAAFFLVAEHRAHVVQFLPYLLLLACPLMHLFHRHGGHERHGHRNRGDDGNGGKQ